MQEYVIQLDGMYLFQSNYNDNRLRQMAEIYMHVTILKTIKGELISSIYVDSAFADMTIPSPPQDDKIGFWKRFPYSSLTTKAKNTARADFLKARKVSCVGPHSFDAARTRVTHNCAYIRTSQSMVASIGQLRKGIS
jgi:hypothetical protein